MDNSKPYEAIRIRMQRNNITQAKLAQLINVNPSTLSNWMNAYSPFPDHIMKKIKDVLTEIEKKHSYL